MAKTKREHTVQLVDGTWYRIANGKPPYLHECCDCSLVHRVAYKMENGVIFEQWTRDEAETKAARKRRDKG